MYVLFNVTILSTCSDISEKKCKLLNGTIEWEHHKRFQGLSPEEIASLTINKYDQIEEERMTKMLGM